MRPTHPPDDRRARHEATGEWPQPTASALLDARARDAGRVFMIEGRREGARQFTFGDLKQRADRMAVALGRLGVRRRRRGVVAASQLVRGRGAGGGDRPHRRRVEPDHHHLPRTRGRLRLPPGAGEGARRSGRGARRRPSRHRRRGARGARPISSTCSPCAPSPPPDSARWSNWRTTPARAAAALAVRPARRVDDLLHLGHHRRPEGRPAHGVDARRRAALSGPAVPARRATTAACCSSPSPTSAAW